MLPRPLPFRGRAFLGLAALVLSLCLAVALSAEAPKSEQILTLGEETKEQPIKAGEAHPWRLVVPPGTSVLVTIDQRSIGLLAEVRGPGDGKPVVFGAGNDRWGPVVLLLETAGQHRITVRPREKGSWPGRYTLRAEAVPSTDVRHEALALMSRAGREAGRDTPESRKKSLAIYWKASAKWHELGERDWEAEARTCVGMREDQSSEMKPAVEDFRAALALWKDLGNSQREAETLTWLGNLYKDTEGVAKAREAWENALDLWHRIGERSDEAQTASNLCLLDQIEGSLQAALTCHEKSLATFRELGAQGDEARVINNLSGIYDRLGEPDAALDWLEQARTLWHALGDRSDEVRTLNNIAKLHRALGDSQEALRIYSQAREILVPLGNRQLEGTVLNNIGYAYDDLGEPERARPYFEDALKLRRETGDRPGEVTTLNNLGSAWRKLGHPKKALDLHRQALVLATSLGDATQQTVSRQRLAEVYLDQNDASAALRELDAAAQLEKVDLRTRTSTLNLRGRALILAGRAREALPVLQEVLARRQAVRDRPGEAETLYALAVADRSLGLAAEARAHAEEALKLVEDLRIGFASPDLRASFLATRRRVFSLLVEILMDQGHDREAFAVSERGRARSLLDALRATPTRSMAPVELLARRRSLLRQRGDKIDQRWKQSGDKAAALEREIDKISSDIDGVEAEIRRQDPRLAVPSTPPAVGPEEISRELKPGTMLLEYSLGEERSFLWAIDTQGLHSFVLPAQKKIEALARQAYKELSAVEAKMERRDRPAEELSRRLLGPIWNGAVHLKRLVIVPDASLQLVPFAALPVPNPGHGWNAPGIGKPLLEHLEVVYVPSATTLAVQRQRLQRRQPASKWAAVFADPVFAASDPRLARRSAGKTMETEAALRGEGARGLPLALEPLPATRREAEAIRRLAPAGKVRLDLGLDATRKAVLSGELRDYRILHFATHAVADLQSPELSGLVLSRVDAAGRPQEGFLGLSDIYELDLDADLVVLSGCRTALGKEVRGEGLMGLTRAFQYAGVPRVVASLWPVEDRATAELMTRFYREMWLDHQPPSAALRAAQQALRRDPRYRDSYLWAGFVLQGDWH
jgi:CHAT domain-containing protein/Flp pilus assembly protein TadD